MSRISSRFVAVAFPLVVVLAVGVGLLLHRFGLGQNDAGNSSTSVDVSRLSTYRIPDSLDFCGERMPLEIPDVHRRMEQAFYIELSDAQIILDLKRSTRYFPYVEEKLSEMNLPEDLKYLAVAESALRNLVSSKGAAGIWQFTPETARRYGLKVNYFVDERFNFTKSTDASLKYLSDLHSMFGTWTLAAAAYNMGKNGISRTVDFQKTSDYYNLYLNNETSRFVFRIVALKQIMSHFETYGFDLKPRDFYQAPAARTVSVGRIYDLATWALQQGTSYKEIMHLNPWLLRKSLPAGSWTLDLPQDSRPALVASVQGGGGDSSGSQDMPQTYIVKRGDSLTKIADRYGVKVGELLEWNDLQRSGYLRAGQKLTIYSEDANLDR